MKKKQNTSKKTKFNKELICNENIIEEFREVEIEGYGKITVNNLGTKVYTKTGKFPSLFLKSGYITFNVGFINNEGKRCSRTLLLHRLVALAFLPNPENLPEVNHKNGNKMKNDVTNLEWCTKEYNISHGWKNNLILPRQGEKHGMSKLKNHQILEIRKKNKQGKTRKELAKEYDVCKSTIDKIINKNYWKNI